MAATTTPRGAICIDHDLSTVSCHSREAEEHTEDAMKPPNVAGIAKCRQALMLGSDEVVGAIIRRGPGTRLTMAFGVWRLPELVRDSSAP